MRTPRFCAGAAITAALLVFTAVPAFAEQVLLTGSGSGADEVPGPGEEGATVRGELTVDTETGAITYTVTVAGNSEDVAAAHIHEAPAGVAGDVVVPLDAAAVNAGSQATASADPALAAEIAASPEQYYINVHSASFPQGFARAQLQHAAPSSVPAGDGSSATHPSLVTGAALVGLGAAAAVAGLVHRRRGGATA